jgi:hypothetical protein
MRNLTVRESVRALAALVAVVGVLLLPLAAKAAEPIRVGLSVALTGGVAPIGKSGATTSTPRAGCSDVRSSWYFMTTKAIRRTYPGSIRN